MCGSKYVSSYPGQVFTDVLKDINNGVYVVFSGTPCQIAGLKAFLINKKVDLTNLFLIDFICHGVGSNRFFDDYINFYEKKYKGKVVSCKFRAHSKPGKKQDMQLTFSNGKKYNAPSTRNDWFYSAYHRKIILRPSCFCCKYASEERLSDITLADDWSHKEEDYSLLIFNSQQAMSLLPDLKEIMNLYECIEEVNQNHLKKPCQKPEDYDKFWDIYKKYGYLRAQTYLGNNNLKAKIKFWLVSIADKLNVRSIIKNKGKR